MAKLTIKQIEQKCRETHGEKFIYDFSNYKTADSKITITCPIHGKFTQNIRSHYNGTGCKRCSKPGSIWTLDEFLTKANEIHEGLYDYGEIKEYTNTQTKVPIKCKEHGVFWQTPHDHLAGKGCSVCAGNNSITTEEFIRKATIKQKGRYSYPRIEKFTQLPKKVTITCELHGDFQQNPNHHLKGCGCKVCGNVESNKRYLDKPTTLYYVKINNYYKIGITTRTVNKRFEADVSKLDLEIIKTWEFSSGKIAYLIEQYLLDNTKQYEVHNCDLLYKGNSEVRSEDIIDFIEKELNNIFN